MYWNNRGLVHEDLGRTEEANEDYFEAIRLADLLFQAAMGQSPS